MNIETYVKDLAKKAKIASRILTNIPEDIKNKALLTMADSLSEKKDYILSKNKIDLKSAKQKKLSLAFIDRLTLNEKEIKQMADSLIQVAHLKDPVGEIIKMWKRPNGLIIGKMRVPIGVIGIIYESRPNVTSDCIGLCLKSANAVILRGGSEAINSNIAIFNVLNSVLKKLDFPDGTINLIEKTDRKAVDIMLGLSGYIDLVIPRGGESLIKEVINKSKIPVIKHYKGVCHVYVDKFADLGMAEKIAYNAKVQRPATCNAMETLLVHQDIAAKFLPKMIKRFKEEGVEIRGCDKTRKIVKGINPALLQKGWIKAATETDWSTEYLDLILSVKIVSSLWEAIEHIARYGTQHSDAIVTENYQNAMEFLKRVDSAAVFVNASTRFTDGYQFGLGAEIGISTDKIHARGPMGLEELTSYKYIVFGNGQVRE